MDELRLRRIFLGLINGSLLLSAAGCGAAGDDTPSSDSDANRIQPGNGIRAETFWSDLELSEFAAPACDENGWRATADLNPALSVDYVSLQLFQFEQTRVMDETGIACATAADPSACQQAVALALQNTGPQQSCGGTPVVCQNFLLSTAGDSVEVWSSPEDVLRFLGPIDTPAEALLRVYEGTFVGYGVGCGDPSRSGVRSAGDGYDVVLTRMETPCAPLTFRRDLLHVAADGSISTLRSQISDVSNGCVGRRPEGLLARAEAGAAEHVLGEFFASVSHLEAASVTAFERLEAELEAFGAPLALREEARRAAADEVRHAAQAQRVAEQFGGRVALPVVEALAGRELEDIAYENIAEGCVRETYGALVAHHQARHASDPEIRSLMRGIAEDETRHAALAWRVAAWAEPRLSSAARERVRTARERALGQLRNELGTGVPAALCDVAGVPCAAAALELLSGLERLLWQQTEDGAAAALS